MQNKVFIGLGANLGERASCLAAALDTLKALAFPRTWQVSSFYETVPVGGVGPDYLNAACSFDTELPVKVFHQILMTIESGAGRVRSIPNAPRVLDLDLLFYGTEIISSADLIVPHPRLPTRAFVLVPLAEIAPEWKHPQIKKSVREMLSLLSAVELSGVKKYDSDPVCQTISNNA
ncbi:MAG TPA: 2-amino-4-hydroxy-6-hydroxymethyldihydropteridine diphosphokinase [Candidatus Omnitrophota bacterium]|nr:2-amino-4-hydroxy-6-hydroxymethyldihydropteridine diphosphokinase [Candidatus Omnitrophota bacterium]HRK61893.1 2-amino-4-hydroxy-6-hydroxymethyldihydropteridine diphosphokinase [Candidatus Omnitrophota bacterium]